MTRPLTESDLTRLGVQGPAPSKVRGPTKRVYATPLDDVALARCRAKARSRASLLKGKRP